MSDTYTNFPTLTYDAKAVERQGWGMAASGPTDDKLIVGFYRKSVLNQARSRAEGKPVHEGRDYVKIQHPGETLNVVDRPVLEADPHRWPRQWHSYQQGVRHTPDGVPINLLFPAKPEIETMLRGYNIHTVEQLAGLSGEGISAVGMGAQEWVNAAQRYMERANKGVNHHQFEKALADKDSQIAALSRQVAEVTALVRQQQTTKPPSPQEYDFQTQQINNTHQSIEPYTPPGAEFVQDLSGMTTTQPKRRGRPPKAQH
jgi:hypothetical protein